MGLTAGAGLGSRMITHAGPLVFNKKSEEAELQRRHGRNF